MISPRDRAPVYAGARLVVDGTDKTITRKAQIALRLSRRQEQNLHHLLKFCCEVYNAALEERSEAYKRTGESISLIDQFNQVTELRETRPDIFKYGVQPLRGALRRLDTAYTGFLQRAGSGKKAGFPRYRSAARYDTVSWDEPVSWKLDLDAATLYIQGVGILKLGVDAVRQIRRFTTRGGVPTTLTITRYRAGKRWSWRATVGLKQVETVKQAPAQGPGSVVGLDRGTVVTVADSSGSMYSMPKYVRSVHAEVAQLQREMAKKKPGSRAHKRLRVKVKRLRSKAAHQVENWAWHTAKQIVAGDQAIVLEDLQLVQMTKSASGTVAKPGKNVAQKKGLNRVLQEEALGKLAKQVCVKAEEAERRTWLVPAQYSSQECSNCGHTDPGNRVTRSQFQCQQCGHTEHADTNAARVLRKRGLSGEAAWRAEGSIPMLRPKPRMQRRKATASP